MTLLVAILAAIVALPLGAVAGTLLGYPLVRLCGVTDFEGKAGFTAAFMIGLPAGVLSAIGAFLLVRHLTA